MEKNNKNNNIQKENGLVIKWGNELFDDGITNAPKCFMRYSRRFVKATHFQLICTILSYQFGSDAPYPARETIAEDMGISVRRIDKLLGELQDMKLIQIVERYDSKGRTSNEYILKPLLDKCLDYSRLNKERKEKEKGIKKKVKTGRRTKCSGTEVGEQSVQVVGEQSVLVPGEQSVLVPPEQSVHPKKVIKESNLEESNINNVLGENSPNEELLNYIDSRQDLKKHTQEIINLFNIFSKDETFKLDVFMKTLEIIRLDVKKIGYLENALMNNLKKGYVKTYDKKQQPKRVEIVPEWQEENQRQWEEHEKAVNENLSSESIEDKRKRLEALQAQFKPANKEKVSGL